MWMASGRQFRCVHSPHESHSRPCWLFFTGFEQVPQGYNQLRVPAPGPGFSDTSPLNSSSRMPYLIAVLHTGRRHVCLLLGLRPGTRSTSGHRPGIRCACSFSWPKCLISTPWQVVRATPTGSRHPWKSV